MNLSALLNVATKLVAVTGPTPGAVQSRRTTVLGVTRSTVAFHVQKIYAKLEVHSKSEAVAKAVRDGIVR